MKFDFSVLKKPVQNIYRNVYSKSKRSPIESFLETSFVFKDNKIILSSNNEQIGLQYFIKTDFKEVEFNISTDVLYKIVTMFGNVDVDIKDNILIIKKDKKKIKFELKPLIENLFFSNDVIENTVESDIDFAYYTKLISPFVSNEKFDEVLSGIYFGKNDITFVTGTNRNIACLVTTDLNIPSNGLLIPAYDFENVDYTFYYNENWLLFKYNNEAYTEHIYHRTLADPQKYPLISKLIDKKRNDYLSFNRKDIMDFIKTAHNLYGGNADYFSIKINNGKAILRAYDLYSSNNEFETEIDVNTSFDMGYYGFNIDLFLRTINISDEKDIKLWFDYNEDSSPFIYIYKNIKSLIMPIRLANL